VGGMAGGMNIITKRFLIAMGYSVFVFAPMSATAGADRSRDEKALEVLFEEAVVAGGKAYLARRDRIVAKEECARAFLKNQRRMASTWKEVLLAEVLIEQTKHLRAIKIAIGLEIDFEWDRRRSVRVSAAGRALAERFADFPMVLAEFVWKGNELSALRKRGSQGLPFDGVDGVRYAIRALALLRETRALKLALSLIEVDGELAGDAASLVGALGRPEAVADLVRMAETNYSARRVLPECVDIASVPELEKAASRTGDPIFQHFLREKVIPRARLRPAPVVVVEEPDLPTRNRTAATNGAWFVGGVAAVASLFVLLVLVRSLWRLRHPRAGDRTG